MKASNTIKRLISKCDVAIGPATDRRILADSLERLSRSKPLVPGETRRDFWRTVMKSKITKVSTAAAIILIAVASITLLDRSISRAWVIEESVEAI